MKGSIHSDQKCPICGRKFRHYEPRGMWCPDHPQCMATRFVVRFGTLTKRFQSYEMAHRTLTAWRYETDLGTFDPRDHRKSHPLGFQTLSERFIKSKRHLRGVKKYEQRLRPAVKLWQNKNVKDIGYADVEDLINDLKDQEYSHSYIYHIVSTIKMFFDWLRAIDEIEPTQGPRKYPPTKNIMAYRKTVDKDTQWAILEEIRRISWDFNSRIYIGVLFLATYLEIRPNELRGIKEKHIEYENGRVLIPSPKEGTPKYFYLIQEDAELLRTLPRALPEVYVFRHEKGNGGAKPGSQFGSDYLQRWWNEACDNLGVKGVSLYPGTRHSSARDLRERRSPEAVKRKMQTRSNKAFDRYLEVTAEEQVKLAEDVRGGRVIEFKRSKKR